MERRWMHGMRGVARKRKRAAGGAFWTDLTTAACPMHHRGRQRTPKPRRAMATRLQRPRIRPTWKGGLRRGTVRDTMTEYLAARPDFAEKIIQISRQLDAWGVEPMSLEGIRQPFDYEPRRTHVCHSHVH